MHAAWNGDYVEVSSFLVQNGATLNTADNDGDTALHCAAPKGHPRCVAYLLSLPGIDATLLNKNGKTALEKAEEGGNFPGKTECAKLIKAEDRRLIDAAAGTANQKTEKHAAEVLKTDGAVVVLRSVHFQEQPLYIPAIDYNAQRRQVFVWKREMQSDVLSKARLVVEVIPGTSRIRLQTRKYTEAGEYVYCAENSEVRGEVLVWKGKASSDILEKAEFEVEPVDGHADQVRLKSVKWDGAYLYIPAIDYDSDRRQVYIWKTGPDADALSKARFRIETAAAAHPQEAGMSASDLKAAVAQKAKQKADVDAASTASIERVYAYKYGMRYPALSQDEKVIYFGDNEGLGEVWAIDVESVR